MWTVLGIRPSPAESRGWIGQTLVGTFGRLYPESAAELVESYLAWNSQHHDELLQEYDGADRLMDELRDSGATIGVVTSKRHASAARSLQAAGLADRLPVVVAMDDTALHKPSPEPLLLALERLATTAERAVYVGDAVVDILAAKAAGMAAIAVTWGAGERAALQAAGPLAVVDTMAELREQLLAEPAG